VNEVIFVLPQVLEKQQWDGLLNSDWKRLEAIHMLLAPFAQHTKNLQSDSMTLSEMLPAVVDLEEHLRKVK
jgi:hypothetical protein